MPDVAEGGSTVLIEGPSGSGKELLARAIHNLSSRHKHPYVIVNCGTLPPSLFESELIGYMKGAFTDAKSEKMGLFEYATNGTIFFDEVGNLSPSAQAKLLKVLEDKKLRKVGDIAEKEINVRVIAATNLHLEKAVNDGSFREDLYYRLNLLTLYIPSLRERPEDIPAIVNHYLNFYATIYRKNKLTINDDAVELLKKFAIYKIAGLDK